MNDIVSVVDLRVSFPGSGLAAVDGVSFSVAAGECLAIVGESGSGKTLTARSLVGLTPDTAHVDAAQLTVAGVDARGLAERGWRRLRGAVVGLVSQDALVSLDPLRRIGNEVAEPLQVHERMSRAQQSERMLELLTQVAIPQPAVRARQYPHELSGGLRQRALIASALAAGPVLLIADEPTTALDVTVQAHVLALLEELKASGLALLLISHDLAVVRHIADRVAVMKDGRFVETAETAALFTAPSHEYTRALLRAATSIRSAPASSNDRLIVLSARDLVKSYRRPRGSFRAVDGVSFDLPAGSTVGIVGESGSGKTTLAKMLLGIEKPDRGEVLLDGEAWSELPEAQRRARRNQIQVIHQNSLDAFDPRFTVKRILAEAVALEGTPRRLRGKRIAELMDDVALPAALLTRRPHQLSGGQQQRVAIARALARRPQILVCDEPVSALDVSVQAQVLDVLAGLQRRMGLAMVFIAHDLSVVRGLSHQILVMKDGVVVEQGETEELFARSQHPFTRQLLASIPARFSFSPPVDLCFRSE